MRPWYTEQVLMSAWEASRWEETPLSGPLALLSQYRVSCTVRTTHRERQIPVAPSPPSPSWKATCPVLGAVGIQAPACVARELCFSWHLVPEDVWGRCECLPVQGTLSEMLNSGHPTFLNPWIRIPAPPQPESFMRHLISIPIASSHTNVLGKQRAGSFLRKLPAPRPDENKTKP